MALRVPVSAPAVCWRGAGQQHPPAWGHAPGACHAWSGTCTGAGAGTIHDLDGSADAGTPSWPLDHGSPWPAEAPGPRRARTRGKPM